MTTPGWYHAEGDPEGTVRYWDGTVWQGEPQLPPAAATANPATANPAAAQHQAMPGYGAQSGGFVTSGHEPGRIETLKPFDYWKKCWTRSFFDFSGRARRAEFGWFSLIQAVIGLLFVVPLIGVLAASEDDFDAVDVGDGIPGLAWLFFALIGLFALASLIPSLAVQVRRWHDLGLTGWMVLVGVVVGIIPVIGALIGLGLTLWQFFGDSKRERNKWGRSLKYG